MGLNRETVRSIGPTRNHAGAYSARAHQFIDLDYTVETLMTMESLLSIETSVDDGVPRKWEDREHDLVDVATITEKVQTSVVQQAMSVMGTCQVELKEKNLVIEQARDEEEQMGFEVIEHEYLAREVNDKYERSFICGVDGSEQNRWAHQLHDLDDTVSVETITTMESPLSIDTSVYDGVPRECEGRENDLVDVATITEKVQASAFKEGMPVIETCRVEFTEKDHPEFIEKARDEDDDDFSLATSKMNGVRETQPIGGPKYYVVSIVNMGKAEIVHEAMPKTDALNVAVAEEKGFEVIEYDFLTRKSMVDNEGCFMCGMGGFEQSSQRAKKVTTPEKKPRLPIKEDGRSQINLASLPTASSAQNGDHYITGDTCMNVERKIKFIPFRDLRSASDKKEVPAVPPPTSKSAAQLDSKESAKTQTNVTSLPLPPSISVQIGDHSTTGDNVVLPLFSMPFRKSKIGLVKKGFCQNICACRVELTEKDQPEFVEQAEEDDDDFSLATSKMNGVRETQPIGGPKYYVVSIINMGKAEIVHEAMPKTDALNVAVAEEKGFEVIEYDFLTRKSTVDNEGCFMCGMGGFEQSSQRAKKVTTPEKKPRLPIKEDGRSQINLTSLPMASSTQNGDHYITGDNDMKVKRKIKFVPFRDPRSASDKKEVPAVPPPPAKRSPHMHSKESAKTQINVNSLPLSPSISVKIGDHFTTGDNVLPLFSMPFRKSKIGLVKKGFCQNECRKYPLEGRNIVQ